MKDDSLMGGDSHAAKQAAKGFMDTVLSLMGATKSLVRRGQGGAGGGREGFNHAVPASGPDPLSAPPHRTEVSAISTTTTSVPPYVHLMYSCPPTHTLARAHTQVSSEPSDEAIKRTLDYLHQKAKSASAVLVTEQDAVCGGIIGGGGHHGVGEGQ